MVEVKLESVNEMKGNLIKRVAEFWLLVTSTTMLPRTGTKLSQSKAEKVLLVLSHHHPFLSYFSHPSLPPLFSPLRLHSTLLLLCKVYEREKKCGEGREAGIGGTTKGVLTPSFTTSSTSTLLQGCGGCRLPR